MTLSHLFPIAFFVFFAFVVIHFLSRMVRFGGFKAALFGAPIVRTVGEVAGIPLDFGTSTVRVHALGGDSPERAVGLEVAAKTFASYHMTPATLSAAEAMRLAEFLRAAAGEKHA
ncbi:MAG: hypothetical protein KGL53_13695 [Elusimicrobia bacterium]|nr:hypothetical protein [Elusimicrobiota bacterium]